MSHLRTTSESLGRRTSRPAPGEEVCRWIEDFCYVPEGRLIGKKIKLADWQRREICRVYDNPHGTRRAILSFGRKNGKGLALDTPVPTPTGWRQMRDIRAGDLVFGSDGKPARVTFVSPVHVGLRCWRLTFADGTEIVADQDHRWVTTHSWHPWDNPRVNSTGNGGRSRTAVVTTPQIAQSVELAGPRRAFNHSVPCAPAVEMEAKNLPIDPYLLGVWIGDGDTHDGCIASGEEDVEYMAAAVGDVLGSAVRVQRYPTRCPAIKTTWTGFRQSLRRLGVLGRKHIPQAYLEGSVEQRRALFQGLMDTDGSISRNKGWTTRQCEFCTASEDLADQVWQLARSLGLKAKRHVALAGVGGRIVGAKFPVTFTASSADAVFRMPRKARLLPEKIGKRSRSVKIVKCEEVASVPTVCIQVDATDELFLAGGGSIPTHNTTLAALLTLAHLCGPRHKKNSWLFSAAQSREQASILFNLAAKIVRMSRELRSTVSIKESGKELYCGELGTRYRALSAEATTAFGLSPSFIVHDELGQVRGPRSNLYEALETATGAHSEPLSVIISTQSRTDADLLSILIDDALAGHDPRVIVSLYTADPTLEPFTKETIRLANPAMGTFLSEKEVLAMAQDASRMPSREAEYRNLVLNQRVEFSDPFIAPQVWKDCTGAATPLAGLDVYAGLDLSEVADLTAFVKIGRDGDGVWHVEPQFWLPGEGLEQKAIKDRMPWDLWRNQGLLLATEGKAVSYEAVAQHLRREFERCEIKKLAFDRWNMRHLTPWLEKAGFSEEFIAEHFVDFGQGFASMSPALRDLEQLVLERKLEHPGHPILTSCVANTVIVRDDAGNRKPSKRKSSGRIDGLVALAMAVGVAPLKDDGIDVDALIG
jgi:phage terminase large subunit-like protein